MHESRPYHPKRQVRRPFRGFSAESRVPRQDGRARDLPHQLEHLEESNPQMNVREFISEVKRLLGKCVPEASSLNRHGASDFDEETIAFYQVEGIIDPSHEAVGDEEEFGYRHLLQALLTKKLQAMGLGIERIRRRLVGRDNSEYEEMLVQGVSDRRGPQEQVRKKAPAKRFREPEPEANRFRDAEPDALSHAQEDELEEEFARFREGRGLIQANAPWVRLLIVPGFEVHLSGDFDFPASPEEYKEVMSRVRQAFLRHFEGSRSRHRSNRRNPY